MGSVLTRGAVEGDADQLNRTQAYVLGGGVVQKSRDMGLVIRPEFKHVEVSKQIAAAINRRLFFFDGTTRRGVAKPVEDDFIEIEMHPRYEHSLGRYFAVLNALVIDQRRAARQERLTDLSMKLGDVSTAADAALQLEALGESAIPTLITGLENPNLELRFYAAEALAYLDRNEAVESLLESIREDSAFRHASLLALEGMNDPRASESLSSLFDVPSIETRYGAFATLHFRPDAGQWTTGEAIAKGATLHEVPSEAPPAVVVSTRKRAEIVVFGNCQPIDIETAILGPGGLVIKPSPTDPGTLRISRFQIGQQDRRTKTPATVAGLVRGIGSIGGNYADIVATLRLAKAKGYLKDQLAIDPLPKALRTYYRDEESSES